MTLSGRRRRRSGRSSRSALPRARQRARRARDGRACAHGHAPRRRGRPVADGLVEIWDRVRAGRWGRSGTDADGRFAFVRKPGRAGTRRRTSTVRCSPAGCSSTRDARVLPGRAEANAADPVLAASTRRDARRSSPRRRTAGLRFDIRLQGERQTVFFAIDDVRARSSSRRRCARRSPTRAWLEAMLDAERALARAALAGVIVAERPAAIADASDGVVDAALLASRPDARRQPGRAARAGAARPRGGEAPRPSRRDEPGRPRHGGDARRAQRASSSSSPSSTARRRRARGSPRRTAHGRWRRGRCSSRRCRRRSG